MTILPAAPQKRNPSADIARGLGIILVVFGHNWIVQHQPGELYRVIFSFHMPLFFFLSGVFLAPDKALDATLRQKADSLLKPYAMVLLILAAWYMIPQQHFSPDYFIGMLYANGQSILWTPLWFLPNLFLAQLIALLLLKAFPQFRSSTTWLALLILAMLLLGIQTLHIGHELRLLTLELLPGHTRKTMGLPWSMDIVLVNTAFLLAGFLGAQYVKDPGRYALTMTLLATAVFALLHLRYDDTLNMNNRLYDSMLVSSLEAFAGIWMTIGLSGLLSRHARCARSLAYVGTASLFIFIFHGVIQGRVTGLLQNQLPNHLTLAAMLGLLAGICVPILIFEACRHSRLLSALLLPGIRAQPQRA